MRVRPCLIAFLLVSLLGCGGASTEPDHQSEWRAVLRHKQAAASPVATPSTKQAYADALSAFVRRHPEHGRAREVYRLVQLEFADDLLAVGRYQDAIRFYRAVLVSDPRNNRAQRGLSTSVDRLAVSLEKLDMIDVGMTERQVSHLLGKPIPGWVVKRERSGAEVQAWYYRTTKGGLAGVYLRDGRVFAAEAQSQARLAR